MEHLQQELGKALRAKDVAEYLGMNVKHIRNHYKDLGGIRLGRHYRFFEKEIYYAIQKKKWVAQVRKTSHGKEYRREKVFLTKKEAKDWESKMRRKPVEEWSKRAVTACLCDWIQVYLDVAKVRFTTKTYKEKVSIFKRFFKVINPALPVSELKPANVPDYIIKQKEARSGYAANKDRKNLVAA
jgi:hypothetical protein